MKVQLASDNITTKSVYYIYFGTDDKDYSTFDKRYLLDSDNYKKTFPYLSTNNWFKIDALDLNRRDSYIGMYLNNSDKNEDGSSSSVVNGSIYSIIFPNELFNYHYSAKTYRYLYVCGTGCTEPEKIGEEWLYKFSLEEDDLLSYYTYIIDIMFNGHSNVETGLSDAIIAYHEVDTTAHSDDISQFASDSTSFSLISDKLWMYNQLSRYSKNTNIISTSELNHKLQVLGTPSLFAIAQINKMWNISTYIVDMLDTEVKENINRYLSEYEFLLNMD